MSKRHKCLDHIVIRHGIKGGKPVRYCGFCSRVLKVRMRKHEVLMRVS